MNELTLKLPGGGIMTIRAQAREEQDSVMVKISGADAASVTMTASALAAADKVEETGKADNSEAPGQPFDCGRRLRMLAQGVEGVADHGESPALKGESYYENHR